MSTEYGTDIRYDPVTSPHGRPPFGKYVGSIADSSLLTEKPHQNKLKTRAHIEALGRSDY